MKVLIEIDEDIMSSIKDYNVSPSQVDTICEQILNGTPLNGTNGEIFLKVYTDISADNYEFEGIIGFLKGKMKEYIGNVLERWWNAEYKAKVGNNEPR